MTFWGVEKQRVPLLANLCSLKEENGKKRVKNVQANNLNTEMQRERGWKYRLITKASKPVGRFAGICLTWQNPAAPDPPVLLALGFSETAVHGKSQAAELQSCRAASSARIFLTQHPAAVSCPWTSPLLLLWARLCSSALNWLVLSWIHHLALRNTLSPSPCLSQMCGLVLRSAPRSIPLMVRVSMLPSRIPCH